MQKVAQGFFGRDGGHRVLSLLFGAVPLRTRPLRIGGEPLIGKTFHPDEAFQGKDR